MTQKERINIVVSSKTKEKLGELQHRLGDCSLTEVLRRSIDLIDIICEYQENGDSVVVKKDDGTEILLKIII